MISGHALVIGELLAESLNVHARLAHKMGGSC